jgi:sigma-B regulation protein RsbU (phosphoserine phosphatase)
VSARRGPSGRRGSITTRLILLLTLALAVIIALLLALDYRLSRDEILERVRGESQDTVRGAITDLDNWLEGIESATLFLARLLEREALDRAGLEKLLRTFVETHDDIFGATIALNPEITGSARGFAPYYHRRDGALTRADLTSTANNYPDRAWFSDAVDAGQALWVEPYYDEGGGEVLMTTFSVPVYHTDRQGGRSLYAVVTADVALAELHGYLQRLRLGRTGSSILLSRSGVVLSDGDDANIMRHYSALTGRAIASPSGHDLFQAALAGRGGSHRFRCQDTDGECELRLGTLSSTGWPVGVAYAEQEILEPLRRFQFKTAALGFVILSLMAAAVYFITRRLTRPLGDLARASAAIARGELDAPLPPARGRDEVAGLVNAFEAMKSDLQRHIRELETATASRSRLEGELAAAHKIQMSLLPQGGEASQTHAGCELWARVRPARSVGGDLFTWFRSGNRLLLAVGDVSDKGVPAALFMARVISLIPQIAEPGVAPGKVMALLNSALERGNDNCMFVTLFLGVLDLHSRELRFASAGHSPPLLLRGGLATELSQQTGPALGLADACDYPENTLELRPGDRLAIYTDGIDEAFNERSQMFGQERCRRQLERSLSKPVADAGSSMFETLDHFAGKAAQSDDITLLLLEVADDSTAAPTPLAHAQRFAAGAGLTGRALAWLQPLLEHTGLPRDTCGEMTLVAEEIVSNIEKYAELGESATVKLEVEVNGSQLTLQVIDSGKPFNPLEHAPRAELGAGIDHAEIGGLGVHLITRFTDEQSYRRSDSSNVLRVSKCVPEVQARPDSEAVTQEVNCTMDLQTSVVTDKELSVARVRLTGGLNTDTAPEFEKCLQQVIDDGYELTVLDMKDLDYISSAGLRVIFKAAKHTAGEGRRLAAANRKPHIDKVFEILKALPDMAVFANDQELDDYLDTMQRRVRGE